MMQVENEFSDGSAAGLEIIEWAVQLPSRSVRPLSCRSLVAAPATPHLGYRSVSVCRYVAVGAGASALAVPTK